MPQPPRAAIGMTLDEIDTPALVLDLDALDRNLRRAADVARKHNVKLRPHAKTHKCPMVALRQIALGAVGNCCQTVGEAVALVEGGVRDVLVSNEVAGERKLMRLAGLATEAKVALCVDSEAQIHAANRAAAALGTKLGALVEIEVGMKRCGVMPGEPARRLARMIADSSHLEFRGLQAYHGTAQHLVAIEERRKAVDGAIAAVKQTLDALAKDGLKAEIVGGAGTGTFAFEAASGVYTELQVGSYAFMDTDYGSINNAGNRRFDDFEHSLFVLASIVSAPEPGRAVCDAGLKQMSAEKGLPWVHGRPGLEVYGISDEHARVRIGAGAAALKLDDKLKLIPGHCDPCINLHDWYIGVRGDRVEALWPITARGA